MKKSNILIDFSYSVKNFKNSIISLENVRKNKKSKSKWLLEKKPKKQMPHKFVRTA